jgi:hypothetical protein
VNQVLGEENRHVVEHQAGDDLVRAQVGTQPAGDEPPGAATDKSADHHGRNEGRTRPTGHQKEGDAGGGDRSHVNLALGPDVPELHLERYRDAQPGQQERCGLDQRFGDGVRAAERAVQHRAVNRQWVLAAGQNQHAADQQRDQDRGDRDQDCDGS